MLKYYSYYNVGGYKDMFLGDSSMNAKETYYLPLLAIWKKKAASGDTDAESKVKSVADLPKIQLLSSRDSMGLPKEAELMFSHGGYKVISTIGSNGESIFAIRDIESDSKDESGRTIPFLLVFVGTTANDAKILEKVTAYACSHMDSFSKELAGLFHYDADINGIVFKLSTIESVVRRISEDGNNRLLTVDGIKAIEPGKGSDSILVLPEGISKDLALNEQGLKGKSVMTIPVENILPLDNQKKLVAALRNIKDVRTSVLKDRRVQYIVGGAIIIGFIVGYFIGKS